ncbi:hypothetical protein [Lactiplantibacillus mudanjiangensis]|uniref:Uncharacterized protein n=1 Tax=Lactiplantibacillus mudanjiangensis TaxID=1296538 RepID=A0A660DVY1_9LACO|nr:hypothetical protein [Lactiplantibacillus mudanjiangensis]VDG23648.1 hypothetical protein [Lactobacillus sp. CBA3605] [Lactiplantibacillus mudanjiangensis]VDG27790.1 hypothetical protein [Lactobacillus sp. CBA3605] [Lactiplantibacillus mudanjiangensis]
MQLLLVATNAVVQHPPHYFMGYTLSEIASIVAIVLGIAGVVGWIVRLAVTKPMENSNRLLNESIKELTKKVEGIGGNADRVHSEHDKRLDAHDIKLARHDEEIKTLFNRTGGKQK